MHKGIIICVSKRNVCFVETCSWFILSLLSHASKCGTHICAHIFLASTTWQFSFRANTWMIPNKYRFLLNVCLFWWSDYDLMLCLVFVSSVSSAERPPGVSEGNRGFVQEELPAKNWVSGWMKEMWDIVGLFFCYSDK